MVYYSHQNLRIIGDGLVLKNCIYSTNKCLYSHFCVVPSCCRPFNVDLNIIEPSFPAHVVLGFNQHWDGQLLKIIWFRAAKILWIGQRVAEYWVHRMSGLPQLGWWIFDSWSIFFPPPGLRPKDPCVEGFFRICPKVHPKSSKNGYHFQVKQKEMMEEKDRFEASRWSSLNLYISTLCNPLES
jgi:hypothetical protein